MTINSTISHEIADELRGDILRQRYRCGDRLPSERDLAGRFDASRGAVREALSQLEQLGLIQILPGGVRVQAIDNASISILGPLMELEDVPDGALVDQFLQTFAALSALTAKTAVEKATEEQLNSLRDRVVGLAKHSNDFEAMQPEWREFIRAMDDIADNLVVRLIGNDLKAQFVEQMMKLGVKPQMQSAVTEELLRAVGEGLANKDGESVAVAVQIHFDELRQAIGKAISARLNGYRQEAV